MMKYFGWRGILQQHEEQQGDNHDTNFPEASSSASLDQAQHLQAILSATCARELHAMWGCRAVSIGCGNDLAKLKSCFEEEGNAAVLSESRTNYEDDTASASSTSTKSSKESPTPTIPCRDIQRRLGSCVTQGAEQLYQRERQRKRRQETTKIQKKSPTGTTTAATTTSSEASSLAE
jgi:hypothetical protein